MPNTSDSAVCLIEVTEGAIDNATASGLVQDLTELGIPVNLKFRPKRADRFDPATVMAFVLTNVVLATLTGISANAFWQAIQRRLDSNNDSKVNVRFSRTYDNGEAVTETLDARASNSSDLEQALNHLAALDHSNCSRCRQIRRGSQRR